MLDKFFKTIEKITPSKYRWILNHDGFKRYFVNTGWMFFGQMFSMLISFFIAAWLARYLGPDNYGVLNYAIAFAGIFSFISSLGLDGILSRELVKFPEKRDELLGTSFRLRLLGGIVAFLLASFCAILFKTTPIVKLLIILFSFSFILQSINIISTYFQAEVKSKKYLRATLTATIISSILKISIILLGQGVIWVIVVYVLDSFWQGIGFLRAYNRYGLKIKNWRFNKILAKSILKDSLPLMLASAASFVYLKIDQVMIGFFLGNYEVGIYTAAVKLVEIWYFFPIIICLSLFPAIINAKKSGEKIYKKRLNSFYVLMVTLSVLIALPISIFAKPIILFLFGGAYVGAIIILKIYTWSSIGLFLGMAASQYLTSENLVKTIFCLNFLAMLINIILNLIFIPKFGLVGAAWATLFSYAVLPILVFVGNKFWYKIG